MEILISEPGRQSPPTPEPPEHLVQLNTAHSLPDQAALVPTQGQACGRGTKSETLSGQDDLRGLWVPQTLSAHYSPPQLGTSIPSPSPKPGHWGEDRGPLGLSEELMSSPPFPRPTCG